MFCLNPCEYLFFKLPIFSSIICLNSNSLRKRIVYICQTEAWSYQKWYQAQFWGRNSVINSSSWRVRGAINPLICSLTPSCVNVCISGLSPSTFPINFCSRAPQHYHDSSFCVRPMFNSVPFFQFSVVGGMKHSSFET